MKCFDQVDPWPSKVNYVDDNNRVLGFDMSQDCCESFGHGVFTHLPTDECARMESPDIAAYSFADQPPVECLPCSDGGGGLAFRIIAKGLPPLFVVIWNHHNGYYAHGWEFDGKEGLL